MGHCRTHTSTSPCRTKAILDRHLGRRLTVRAHASADHLQALIVPARDTRDQVMMLSRAGALAYVSAGFTLSKK